MNILDIPVYYISFNANPELESMLTDVGFTDVHHFNAVDGRKMDVDDLLKKGVIGIRGYNDLVYGRSQHTGLTSGGAVGCTLSHLGLWKLCVDLDIPYMCIIEDDFIPKKLSESDHHAIKKTLGKTNGVFMGTTVKKPSETLFGTHFYIVSKEACKKLIKKALPLDIQTDSYIGHLNNIGDITVEGYKMGSLKNHKSSIQTTCVKCILPNNRWFYIGFLILLIFMFVLCIFLLYRLYTR